jgi:hypothetical protein
MHTGSRSEETLVRQTVELVNRSDPQAHKKNPTVSHKCRPRNSSKISPRQAMHSDEDIKDGRYFPSEKEQVILMQTIEKYFQLPERSEDRSIVVQTVTAQLSDINPRWTNRAVRLWFNNNKRACLKSHVQFDGGPGHGPPVNPDQMPLKKRPPRSPSVGSFLPTRPFSVPSEFGIADPFGRAFTDQLVDQHARKWRDTGAVASRFQLRVERSGLVPEIEARYATVDCGLFIEGMPVVVDVDGEQEGRVLRVGDAAASLACPFHASSIVFDTISDSFLMTSPIGATIPLRSPF